MCHCRYRLKPVDLEEGGGLSDTVFTRKRSQIATLLNTYTQTHIHGHTDTQNANLSKTLLKT